MRLVSREAQRRERERFALNGDWLVAELIASYCGVWPATIHGIIWRCRKNPRKRLHGLTVDRWCVALGYHPSEIYGVWWEDGSRCELAS